MLSKEIGQKMSREQMKHVVGGVGIDACEGCIYMYCRYGDRGPNCWTTEGGGTCTCVCHPTLNGDSTSGSGVQNHSTGTLSGSIGGGGAICS